MIILLLSCGTPVKVGDSSSATDSVTSADDTGPGKDDSATEKTKKTKKKTTTTKTKTKQTPPPELLILATSPVSALSFEDEVKVPEPVAMQQTPWFSGENTLISDGWSASRACALTDAKAFLGKATVTIVAKDCERATSGATTDEPAPKSITPDTHHRRNANRALSAVIVDPPKQVAALVAFAEGANLNLLQATKTYQNTVNDTITADKCVDEIPPDNPKKKPKGGYETCPEARHYFINVGQAAYTKTTDWGRIPMTDWGPVLWPSEGYLDEKDAVTSVGVRAPSALVWGDHIYVYYLDTSISSRGIRVARGHRDALASPGSFSVWDGKGFTLDALPKKLDKSSTLGSLSQTGPVGSAQLFDDANHRSVRFTVSIANADKDDPLFVGVEEWVDAKQRNYVGLRTSTDLVLWSEAIPIPSLTRESYLDGILHDPVLLDPAGLTHEEIDVSEFIVMGNSGTGVVTVATIRAMIR